EARGEGRGKPGCGIPYSNEPEETMRVKLWVGVAQSGRSPAIWIPMKWDPEGDGILRAMKPREEGLKSNNIKPNETRTP
ncbi:MAG: hypothetical protein QXQ96_10395, partial [Sulfolobales archaeon]